MKLGSYLVCLTLAGCVSAQLPVASPTNNVEVSDVLANPQSFNGKRVRVRGIVNSCGVRDCVLRDVNSKKAILSLGVGIDEAIQPYLRKVVVIEATFNDRCRRSAFVCFDRAEELNRPVVVGLSL